MSGQKEKPTTKSTNQIITQFDSNRLLKRFQGGNKKCKISK